MHWRTSKIFLKPIEQSTAMCGPACLVSLLDFYGIKKSEKELAKLSGATFEAGASHEGLVRALRKFSFKVTAKSGGSWELLRKLTAQGIPALVGWYSDYTKPADEHYSLVYRVNDKSIYMMDPEIGGYRRMTRRRFLKFWHEVDPKTGRPIRQWYLFVKRGT